MHKNIPFAKHEMTLLYIIFNFVQSPHNVFLFVRALWLLILILSFDKLI